MIHFPVQLDQVMIVLELLPKGDLRNHLFTLRDKSVNIHIQNIYVTLGAFITQYNATLYISSVIDHTIPMSLKSLLLTSG